MRPFLHALAAALGSGFILLAVLAYRLGFDHNPDWGFSRVVLAVVGAALLVAAVLSWRRKTTLSLLRRTGETIGRVQARWAAWWLRQPVSRWMRRAGSFLANLPGIRWLAASPARRAVLAFWLGCLALGLIYVWYMTAGTLTQWFPYFHDYFDRLAQAFLHGQAALLEQPDPALLALANPYVYANRAGVSYPWDVSLFQGKFYLYWGPVPGLIAAAVRGVAQIRVEDQVLALAGQVGVGAVLAAILAAMRRRFAPGSNPFGLWILILAGGGNLYMLWPNGRPGVYEAAILSGQFFLLAGILVLFFALQHPARGWLPGLFAGFFLALALGSRATLAAAVGWLVCLTTWRLFRERGASGRRAWGLIVALWLPLLLGGSALLWYNYIRFGSIIETGLSYQLSIPQYPPERSWLFSLAYLLPNLFGYLLRAPLLESQFPFIHVPFIQETAWPWYIRLPEHYIYHEPQAGLLMVLPLSIFALIPLWQTVRGCARKPVIPPVSPEEDYRAFWQAVLAGAAVLQMGLILLYFFSALRFQMEIVPLVFLLACLGVWQADRAFASRPAARGLLWLVVILLALTSLLVGLSGAFAAGDQRFEANNPHLYAALRGWFDVLLR